MSLRINHNIAAMNAHRNLAQNDFRMTKTLERLSSGVKINRGADGPAALVISEQIRAQVAGLTQAVMNSESAVSMVQTTEAALNEVNSLLISIRQLAIHAANDGVNDELMLSADQSEIENSLDTIDRIARTTTFGTKNLLNGEYGVSGITTGNGLYFIRAGEKTKSSAHDGYGVDIFQEATQSRVTGTKALTQYMIDNNETLTIKLGAKSVQYTTETGESLKEIRNGLKAELLKKGMELDVFFDEVGRLTVVNQLYGSKHIFSVASSTAGVLSEKKDTLTRIANGQDIQGSIAGELARGDGQFLIGETGTTIEGLTVQFTGNARTPGGNTQLDRSTRQSSRGDLSEDDRLNRDGDKGYYEVGRVMVVNNALNFQIGGNRGQTIKFTLPDSNSENLARMVDNESNFGSLRDVNVTTSDGAQDSLLLVDRAIDEVTGLRAELGSLQKNALESNIIGLRIAKENMVHAGSVLGDTDMAIEMSDFTRHEIMIKSATAMLAQANQTPKNVLTLLK